MSRGQNPLVLMMALTLPGAAHALGLGEIHVNSALNEPLAADIEILGATAEELSTLTASVANKDTFLRFGAERPAFLASATFKVSHDVKGKPVLLIRSTDSFSEPLVNLLVDLRWHNGEVIRQYSLLLDPAGFPAATQVAAAVRSPQVSLATLAAPTPTPSAATVALAAAAAPTALAAPVASPEATVSPAATTTRATTHVKIGAKATLRGVAWRVGARSDSDIKKTMLAIFRANPHAFEGNINRLRLGAVLTIPSAADISTISKEDAGREIQAQMMAWHASPAKARTAAAPVQAMPAPAQGITPTVPAATAVAATASTAVADAPRAATKAGGDAAEAAALNLRVQSLERGLHDIQGQLEREHSRLLNVQAQVRYAEEAANLPLAAAPAPRQWLLPSLIGGLALLAGALGAMFLKLRRRVPKISANAPQAVSPVVLEPSPPAKHAVAEEPVSRETQRTMPRPVWRDSNEFSASWNSEREEQEVTAQQSAAVMKAAVAAPRKAVFTVNEDELRAAYEDTLDLSGDTAILAAETAAASGDAASGDTASNETANLPAATVNLDTHALQAAAAASADESATVIAAADESATVIASADELHVDTTKLDYNLVDLDLTAQHVNMPSVLNERAVVKERRTNLVDVLKKAVEREPDRRDLRMKLLETYYAAAAANRQAFLDVVQKLARDRDRLDQGEWDKIAFMGKQIASDTTLFSSDSEAEDDNKLADCA
jgi:pilus assembly protein FimV